ncbi:glycosyltransferase [Myxococcus sp. Y35]|uniref:glycosyltransferase n=1 Tax=Pseudomyxococcus flavus TaxID=3115648 RepID=UPI003CE7E149
MTRRATLLMEAAPYANASGYINALLANELSRLGYTCESFHQQHPVPGNVVTPLATADRIRRLRGSPTADLAIYCDRALAMRLPHPEQARKTLVLFHGLMGSPATWLESPAINGHWVISQYMEDALTSLLALPDWRERRTLHPHAFQTVSRLVPPLPCVDEAGGHPELKGAELPDGLRAALEGRDVIGHAIQPRKPDWGAVSAIMLNLNALAVEHGQQQRFRLVIDEEDFGLLKQAFVRGDPAAQVAQMGLDALGLTLEDMLIPTEKLSQPALFHLFRAARFGLAYNGFPEPFGFYVLESVFNGCPVYTNGSGNNRFALPPGHGIHVQETADMHRGDVGAYAEVAARILADVDAPASTREACQRGREYIQRTFTHSAFAHSVETCLARLEAASPAPVAFDNLEVAMGPLVRVISEDGFVVSDFEHASLTTDELQLLRQVRGVRAHELRHIGDTGLLQGLFSKGVLTLRPPPL